MTGTHREKITPDGKGHSRDSDTQNWRRMEWEDKVKNGKTKREGHMDRDQRNYRHSRSVVQCSKMIGLLREG